jgi:hypothetical protein
MLPGDRTFNANPLLAIGEQWLATWRLGVALSFAGVASLAQFSDPRQLRKVWSANLTEMIDRSMRSPEFLRLMACQLRAMADVAKFTSALRSR